MVDVPATVAPYVVEVNRQYERFSCPACGEKYDKGVLISLLETASRLRVWCGCGACWAGFCKYALMRAEHSLPQADTLFDHAGSTLMAAEPEARHVVAVIDATRQVLRTVGAKV
jgi:hypothetical protein